MSLIDTAFYVPKQPRGSAFWKLLLMLVLIMLALQRVCHAEETDAGTSSLLEFSPHKGVSVVGVLASLVITFFFFK